MFRPDTRHLATIYRSLGTTYDERVLPSIGNEVLKATVAQFDAAELITQREVVSARIRQDLLKRAGEFNIILEDVSLVRLPLFFLASFAGTDESVFCPRAPFRRT
jgi:prohibitin 1